MASSTADGEDDESIREIRLVSDGDWWVATDAETGVASQGKTRERALENLDEALGLHRADSEPVDTADERELLRDIGIDPDEVEQVRADSDELPEFMQ
jgi:predicted RNase H-like HicB family nuclease